MYIVNFDLLFNNKPISRGQVLKSIFSLVFPQITLNQFRNVIPFTYNNDEIFEHQNTSKIKYVNLYYKLKDRHNQNCSILKKILQVTLEIGTSFYQIFIVVLACDVL